MGNQSLRKLRAAGAIEALERRRMLWGANDIWLGSAELDGTVTPDDYGVLDAKLGQTVNPASVSVGKGICRITGTDVADDVTITYDNPSDSFRIIDRGSLRQTVNARGLSGFRIDVGDGSDTVTFNLPAKDKFRNLSNTIYGGGGNDTIIGSAGKDRIYSSDGEDVISGGAGADKIYGEGGDDRVNAGSGNDHVWGSAGDDILGGGNGKDYLSGDIGDDTIDGGNNNDTIDGGAGQDSLAGGPHRDSIFGGSGNDLISGNGGDDTLEANGGYDTIVGGDGNDRLLGEFEANVLVGGDGNDAIYGGNGNDTLNGGAGEDDLFGEDGNDVIAGGPGNDDLYPGYANSTDVESTPSSEILDLQAVDSGHNANLNASTRDGTFGSGVSGGTIISYTFP